MYGLDYSAMKVCVQTLWFVFIVLFYIYERRMGLSPWLAGISPHRSDAQLRASGPEGFCSFREHVHGGFDCHPAAY